VEPASAALTAARKMTAHAQRETVLLGTVTVSVSHRVTAQSKLVMPTVPAFLSSMLNPFVPFIRRQQTSTQDITL